MQHIAIGIYGSGGSGREVMPIACQTAVRTFPADKVSFYFVETAPKQTAVNGYPVLSEARFFEVEADSHYFNIGIGNSHLRESISARMVGRGAKILSLTANGVTVYDACGIGPGAVLCANSIITSNVKIGRFFHLNVGSLVMHDCVIGDFVTFAPNVACNGNVQIGDHAYVGAGAVIKQGSNHKPLVIGEGAVVGMGAVVTKDVDSHSVVVGNPARPLVKL